MKYFILSLCLLLLPGVLLAKEKFSLQERENTLRIAGVCTGDIQISLAPTHNPKKTAYSAGVTCQDGAFEFSDDLTKWNLKEGQYALWVNGEPAKKRVTIKPIEVEKEESVEEVIMLEEAPKNTFEKALSDFGEGLGQLTQALGIMEENISEHDYINNTVKQSLLAVMRVAVETLGGFLADLGSEKDQNVPLVVTPEPSVEGPALEPQVEEALPSETVSETPLDTVLPEEFTPEGAPVLETATPTNPE